MKNISLNDRFSHIYVEKAVSELDRTKKILSKLGKKNIIYIDHYKDVFNRRQQQVTLQKMSQSLIIARKDGRLIYDGAPVCQSFGNKFFYYTSLMMNCIYDCDYCYLKGMYPSGHMVLFVNIEDYFKEIKEKLKRHPMYISVSYDADLLSLEGLTDYVKLMTDFVLLNKDLSIEIRTKAAPTKEIWDSLKKSDRVVYAFTLSPEEVAQQNERYAPSVDERIRSIKEALERGFNVRVCIDPVIYVMDYEEKYRALIKKLHEKIDLSKLKDVSVGTFRISKDFLKNIRKQEESSVVVQFPFELTDGYYHYPARIEKKMINTVLTELKKYLPEEKIFLWES